MSEFDQFVGLPYIDRGRDILGCDCWGLARLVTEKLRGITLPSFSEEYETSEDLEAVDELIRGKMQPWDIVPKGHEQKFDFALIREGRLPSHIGVVTAPDRVLHIEKGSTSRIERYKSGPLKFRLVGFYRFRAP